MPRRGPSALNFAALTGFSSSGFGRCCLFWFICEERQNGPPRRQGAKKGKNQILVSGVFLVPGCFCGGPFVAIMGGSLPKVRGRDALQKRIALGRPVPDAHPIPSCRRRDFLDRPAVQVPNSERFMTMGSNAVEDGFFWFASRLTHWFPRTGARMLDG